MSNSKDFIFVSGNVKKVEYLERFLDRKVKHHHLDLVEIQSTDPFEVVEHKAREAYRLLKQTVIIEDTALTFQAFGKLPGPFIKFFLAEVGLEGLCRMLDPFSNRSATASVIYGLFDGKEFKAFAAEMNGTVPDKPQAGRGMGWDPIFIPEGLTKTYGEMTEDEYNQYAVRRLASLKLANHFKYKE